MKGGWSLSPGQEFSLVNRSRIRGDEEEKRGVEGRAESSSQRDTERNSRHGPGTSFGVREYTESSFERRERKEIKWEGSKRKECATCSQEFARVASRTREFALWKRVKFSEREHRLTQLRKECRREEREEKVKMRVGTESGKGVDSARSNRLERAWKLSIPRVDSPKRPCPHSEDDLGSVLVQLDYFSRAWNTTKAARSRPDPLQYHIAPHSTTEHKRGPQIRAVICRAMQGWVCTDCRENGRHFVCRMIPAAGASGSLYFSEQNEPRAIASHRHIGLPAFVGELCTMERNLPGFSYNLTIRQWRLA
uniref:Uncharacterized protein n=1 Tax=Vespula pensylvanica TaxID=30213 RepID=A0A834PDG4_VESPE|nr:hypothetical protein H0235_000090 [Vespula pensylvanica]